MKLSKTTLTLAVTAAMGSIGTARAVDNPFSMQSLDGGYMQLADAKASDGKCGEGKCGDSATKEADKSKDGSCGDDKSPNKTGGEDKTGEGSCGGKK